MSAAGAVCAVLRYQMIDMDTQLEQHAQHDDGQGGSGEDLPEHVEVTGSCRAAVKATPIRGIPTLSVVAHGDLHSSLWATRTRRNYGTEAIFRLVLPECRSPSE
jgi:hypothetical protein